MSEIKECPVIALVRATVRARCEALSPDQAVEALDSLESRELIAVGSSPRHMTGDREVTRLLRDRLADSDPRALLYGAIDREAHELADKEWPRAHYEEEESVDGQAGQHAYCRALLSLSAMVGL